MKARQKEKVGKPNNSGKRLRKIKISSGLYIAPSFIGVMLFFIIPFIVVLYYSLINNPISGEFVFLDNIAMVLKNAAFKKAAANTLK